MTPRQIEKLAQETADKLGFNWIALPDREKQYGERMTKQAFRDAVRNIVERSK